MKYQGPIWFLNKHYNFGENAFVCDPFYVMVLEIFVETGL